MPYLSATAWASPLLGSATATSTPGTDRWPDVHAGRDRTGTNDANLDLAVTHLRFPLMPALP